MLGRGLNRGGLEDYYRSPLADTANDLVSALAEIGVGAMAGLMSEANQLFDDGRPPEDTAERVAAFEDLSWAAKAAIARLDLRVEQEVDDLTPRLHAYLLRQKA